MQFVFEAGKRRRVMHIMKPDRFGDPLFRAFCGIRLAFNRTINIPLGCRTCKNCLKKANYGDD